MKRRERETLKSFGGINKAVFIPVEEHNMLLQSGGFIMMFHLLCSMQSPINEKNININKMGNQHKTQLIGLNKREGITCCLLGY